MPSIDEVFAEIQAINTNLGQLHTDIGQLTKSVERVAKGITDVLAVSNRSAQILVAGFDATNRNLIAIAERNEQALAQLSFIGRQGASILCTTEKISESTCGVWNETAAMRAHSEVIASESRDMKQTLMTAHPDAGLALLSAREHERRLNECCPEPAPPDACAYSPCESPGSPPEIVLAHEPTKFGLREVN